MHNKFILGVMLLGLSLTAMPVTAAERGDATVGGKITAQSAKCWKRILPSDASGNDPICRDFEKILNATCEPPEKLRCNWTLPEGEKRFKKVVWQPLDWREYRALIGDTFVNLLNKEAGESSWKTYDPTVVKEYEEGKRSLWVTQVDIDRDGKIENIIREETASCPCKGRIFGVMTPETGRLDFKNENLYYHFHLLTLADGAEIIFYYGYPFIFTYENVPKPGIVRIYKYYRYEQCRFFYQK